jgi:hypothetical protein
VAAPAVERQVEEPVGHGGDERVPAVVRPELPGDLGRLGRSASQAGSGPRRCCSEQTVRLLFETFRRTGSVSATIKHFREQGLMFPTRLAAGPRKNELAWGPVMLREVMSRYNYKLDPKVYLIDRLPIAVHESEVLLVGAITVAISAVATLFPSLQASALRPVDGLRYD